ncbi:MAG: AMP-binding protein, partial [Burkholderiales bacterium]
MSRALQRPLRAVRLGPRDVAVERRADGTVLLASGLRLEDFPRKITERLEHWAAAAPERVLFAQRSGGGWRRLAYGEAL